MTHATTHPDVAVRPGVVCVCRDAGVSALLEPLAAGGRVYRSAADALLAATREPPAAVVLALDPTEASIGPAVDAFRGLALGAPVYALVEAAEEPLARSLRGAGLSDYFVLPGGIHRLARALSPEPAEPEPPPPPSAEAAEPPEAEPAAPASAGHLFDAACRLGDLAMAAPATLFRKGTRVILKTVRAERGCAFLWSEKDERMDLSLTIGGNETLGAAHPDPVRAAATRCFRTGEPLRLPPGTADTPPGGLVAVPVGDDEAAVGVICLSPSSAPEAQGVGDDALGALARTLARLYRAAARREEYARLAHRDVETGLLKANPFLAYVDGRIAEARDRRTELALVLLEPEASVAARTADSPARLGLAVRGALARGWEGGRLETARYAVALPAETPAAASGDADPAEAAAQRLAGAGPRTHPDLSLRTAVARFPHDGTSAQSLVSAAEARLQAATGDAR